MRTRNSMGLMHFATLLAFVSAGCTSRSYNEARELRLPARAPLVLASKDQRTKNTALPQANYDVTEEQTVNLDSSKSISKNSSAVAVNEIYSDSNVLIMDENDMEEDEVVENDAEATLQEDSEKSPEELAQIVPEAGSKIEDSFALCEGSVYLNDWNQAFETRWRAENARKFKRKKEKHVRKALNEARSQAYLQLLYPALGSLEFDYPAVITEDVIKWMQYFQTRGRSVFVTWLRRAQDVTPEMKQVLESKGLPQDLVFLSMIESGFNNRAMSVARAAGPWQFMRATGRIYGLRVDDYVDERRDPEKATVAAAAYLTTLYSMFGDWHLASASYNAGEGRVYRAMRGEEQKDFFSLSEAKRLPNETRNYVPKIIAAMIIGKNPTRFGFDVTDGSRAMKSKKIEVKRSIVLADLAKETGLELKVLESLNPELRLGVTPPPKGDRTSYQLRVPDTYAEKATQVAMNLPEAPLYRRVVTRAPRRETVKTLARRIGFNLPEFLKANPKLKATSRLAKGQVISVPVKLGSGQFEKVSGDREPVKKKKKSRKSKYRAKKTSKSKLRSAKR